MMVSAVNIKKDERKAINTLSVSVGVIFALIITFVSLFLASQLATKGQQPWVVDGQPTVELMLLSTIMEFLLVAIVGKLLLYKLLLRPGKKYQMVLTNPQDKPVGRWILMAIGIEIAISVIASIIINITHKEFNIGGVATFIACQVATTLTIQRLLKQGRATIQFKE